MKAILKYSFISAFVASALLVSCFQEKITGDGETVVFSAGFVGTKTAFGPADNSIYPVLWSKGDKITVNGVVSSEVGSDGAGKASATFKVAGVSAPYKLACPASVLSSFAGGRASLFLPTAQTWTRDSYDPGAMVMLAKSSGTEVGFTPVMSVLKISTGNMGDAVKSIRIKSLDGKKISGAFSTDFESLTPASGASDVLEVTASSPVTAGTDWYVLIPAGDYHKSGFEIVVTDPSSTEANFLHIPSVPYEAGRVYTPSLMAVAPKSVTISGHDGIVSFSQVYMDKNDFETVIVDGKNQNLTNEEMGGLRSCIGKVSKELVFKNIRGWSMVEWLFNWNGTVGTFAAQSIEPQGSIRFIDCPDLDNFGGMRAFTRINGDLEITGCKPIWNWGSFTNISEVKGSVTVKSPASMANGGTNMNLAFFKSLSKVGGDFHFESCDGCNFWQFADLDIQEIGGTLKIVNCKNFNNFGPGSNSTHAGLKNVRKAGGVYIKGNSNIPALGSGNPVGFDLIQQWINKGVVSFGNVECYDHNGKKVNFSPAA